VPDERVHDEAARYRELVHVLDEGVVFQDRTGTVVAANDAAGRILGVDPDDLIGSTANDPRFSAVFADGTPLQPDEHPPSVARLTGEPQSNVIMHVRRPDGVYVWLSVNARPVFEDGGNEPTGVVLSFTDITGQRDFEAQRMESLGRLAGGIAHDFNNLLGVILNYASVIAKRAGADDRITEDARRIQEAADHGTDLVRQLLLFSRQEGRVARRFDVRPVVDEMVELVVRPFAPRIELEVRHSEAECVVAADRGQLGQVLLNLLLNARDAIEGAGHITVTTEKQVDGADVVPGPVVVIAVSDDGSGMAPEVQARAFEPFFTTKVEGSGLGLSAAYGSITAVGGRITIESALDAGSTVRVVLPFDPTGGP
jgi:PAS domain S-box-containing protein